MKLKLYRIGGRALASPTLFGEQLISDAYDNEKEIGFTVTQVRRDLIRAAFVEKRKRRFQLFDSSNNARVVELETIAFTKFEIHPQLGFLVLFDTHAPANTLIARLGLLSAFKTTVEQCLIPLQTILKFLSDQRFTVRLNELIGSNIKLSPEVEAVVRLRGQIELSAAKSASFIGRKGELVSARLICESQNERFLLSWKPAATLEFNPAPEGFDEFLLDLLRHVPNTNTAQSA